MRIIYRPKRSVPPTVAGLKLMWDDIANVPVGNVNSVSDWNNYFDLPTNGDPFTSVVVDVNKVMLVGGSNLNITYQFTGNANIIEITDNTNCITNLGSYSFDSCINLTTVSFPVITTASEGLFYFCNSLVNVEMPLLTSLSDYAFYGCTSLIDISVPNITSIPQFCFGNYCYLICNISHKGSISNPSSKGISYTRRISCYLSLISCM